MNLLTYCCFLILAVLPHFSFACRPIAGHEYKIPTEEERSAEADVVFSGRVVAVKEAPEMSAITQHPHTYLLTMDVGRWLKGSGRSPLEIVDTAGTDCDGLLGISHIFIPVGSSLPSSEWRVFARKSQGRLWVITAYQVK